MAKRQKAIPRGFGLWPLSLAIKWLKSNGYETEAAEIEAEQGGVLIPAGMAIGLHYLFALIDEKKADEFFSIFQSGLNLNEGHPVAILRQRIIAGQRERSNRLTGSAMYFYTVSSWNAFVQGTALKRLTFAPDTPTIEIENLPKKVMKDLL